MATDRDSANPLDATTGAATMTRPVFIRLAKCQEQIGVHRSTVYRWAEKGLIKIYKRGAISLVRLDDVEKLFSTDHLGG